MFQKLDNLGSFNTNLCYLTNKLAIFYFSVDLTGSQELVTSEYKSLYKEILGRDIFGDKQVCKILFLTSSTGNQAKTNRGWINFISSSVGFSNNKFSIYGLFNDKISNFTDKIIRVTGLVEFS